MLKKVVAISIILLCIITLSLFSIPAIAILGEPLLVRWDIQNPYVNHRFRDWNSVQVDGVDAFLIPEGWTLQKDDVLYRIIDDSGNAWAYGAVIGAENSIFDSFEDVIAAAYQIPLVSTEYESFPGASIMGDSHISKINVQDIMGIKTYLCLDMVETIDIKLVWVLPSETSEALAQFDIAEAMVYSFAFNTGRQRQLAKGIVPEK